MAKHERYMEVHLNTQGKPDGLRTPKAREVLEEGIPKEEADKKDKLSVATVTISTGKVFYADTASRLDMLAALYESGRSEATTAQWKLAEEVDGSKWAEVTIDEMAEASILALQFKGGVIS